MYSYVSLSNHVSNTQTCIHLTKDHVQVTQIVHGDSLQQKVQMAFHTCLLSMLHRKTLYPQTIHMIQILHQLKKHFLNALHHHDLFFA